MAAETMLGSGDILTDEVCSLPLYPRPFSHCREKGGFCGSEKFSKVPLPLVGEGIRGEGEAKSSLSVNLSPPLNAYFYSLLQTQASGLRQAFIEMVPPNSLLIQRMATSRHIGCTHQLPYNKPPYSLKMSITQNW
jgi:hypothetical protein